MYIFVLYQSLIRAKEQQKQHNFLSDPVAKQSSLWESNEETYYIALITECANPACGPCMWLELCMHK